MFSALKRLFSRPAPSEPEPALTIVPRPEEASAPAAEAAETTPAQEPEFLPVGNDPLLVPLAAVLRQLPKELHGKLGSAGIAGHSFTIPKSQVLAQLPRGAVKVPFGELRQSAPRGVFTTSPTYDNQLVDLPLPYLLRQLLPEDYSPQAVRPRLEASAEIADLFDSKGESRAQLRVLGKDELLKSPDAAKPPLPQPVPAIPETASRTAAAKPRASRTAATKKSAPPAASAKNPPSSVPSAASTIQPFLVALDEIAVGWPETIRQEIAQLKIPCAKCALPPAEICEGLKRGKIQYTWGQLCSYIYPVPPDGPPSGQADTVVELPLSVVTPLFLDFIRFSASHRGTVDAEGITEFFRRAASARSARPSSPPAPQPPPTSRSGLASTESTACSAPTGPPSVSHSGAHLSLPLSLVSNCWPEPVQKEIAQWGLSSAKLEIPLTTIESALRQGKAEFLCYQIYSWLKPGPPPGHESPFAEARVSLPLSVVAPLFLQQQKARPSSLNRSAVPDAIPDLFSARGSPAVGTPPEGPGEKTAPGPAVAPASVQAHGASAGSSPVPTPAAKAPSNLAEFFGEPAKRKWTPNDIVHKTVQLPGVAGALIALDDGLLVASCLPPSAKGETIAAFLPQVMGRTSQYAKQLLAGTLKSLTLTTDNGVLQIHSAGVIYFAVLGKPGAALPMEKLAFVAAELGRRST